VVVLKERMHMGEKDLSEKILEDYNDVFADIINGLIFKGEQRVLPDDLRSTSVHSQYKADDSVLHELERDISKYWTKSGVEISLYGIENQTKVEKSMPFRVSGYEGMSNRQQVLDKREKFIPVITIILYFGTKRRWRKNKSILEMLDIPEGLEKYVNDCKIHVFEIAWLTEEEINRFKSDFRIVANFFVNKRKDKNYTPNDKQEIQHVDALLKLLSVMSKDNRYENLLMGSKEGDNEESEVKNMCEVAERLEMKGRAEGLALGRTEGLALGRAEGLALGRTEGLALGRNEGLALGKTEGLALGRNEGLALGRTEGLALGRNEGRLELISNMIKNGATDEQVKHFLQVTDEEIAKARRFH